MMYDVMYDEQTNQSKPDKQRNTLLKHTLKEKVYDRLMQKGVCVCVCVCVVCVFICMWCVHCQY